MSNPKLEDDPIAFAKAAAEQLGPLGVQYLEFGGMKLAFTPMMSPVQAAPPSGLSPNDEQDLERLMEADSAEDPLDDPMTFPGGKLPSYGARPRAKRAEREERD